ncbi:MAG: hypothetical protein IMF18_03505 [Proteobacteria bacterium]|nr:hypothetical protein [Pseudomonadota bacterium]
MKRNILHTVLIVGLISCFAVGAIAEMGSENYRIPTSVMSGGGEPMDSATYKTNSTVGQPSPLMDPAADPPYSDSYYNYPGFWYTLEGGIAVCNLASFAAAFGSVSSGSPCDSDYDGDVDGLDLAAFAAQ